MLISQHLFACLSWELTDSNGEAEAGIPLEINIFHSRNRTY